MDKNAFAELKGCVHVMPTNCNSCFRPLPSQSLLRVPSDARYSLQTIRSLLSEETTKVSLISQMHTQQQTHAAQRLLADARRALDAGNAEQALQVSPPPPGVPSLRLPWNAPTTPAT